MEVKVSKSFDGYLEFDNGVAIESYHDADCCEENYLDFEQFVVGAEFPTMSVEELCRNLTLKPDGLILKDSEGIPKWAQARSEQNGYYSYNVGVAIKDNSDTYILVPKNRLEEIVNGTKYSTYQGYEVLGKFDPAWRKGAYGTDIVWVNTKDKSTIPAEWAECNDKE